MHNKRTVITGGAGFIGSNLADELALDNEVIIIDDLSTGKIDNIKSILKKSNIQFIRGCVTDLNLLETSFKGVDYVFHQAAITSVIRSIEDPELTNDVNIRGTLNVLLAAMHQNIKKVIFASSSAVYGNAPTVPKTEKMNPMPVSPYAVTKLAGEHYCRIFENIYHIPCACLRYFNVYGPRQNPKSKYSAVIPKFIESVSKKKSPSIFGDGKQTRDFVFVKDVVAANILAANSEVSGVFNIGTGITITMSELAQLVIELIGEKFEPTYKKQRPGDIRHSLADISRAKSFGYIPKYSLREGLRETINQFHMNP